MVPRMRSPWEGGEKRDGWRLALDVAPVANANESHEDVVGDLFLQAATQGLMCLTPDVTDQSSTTSPRRNPRRGASD